MPRATPVEFPELPERWIEAAQRSLPGLARDIEQQVRSEIPEYADDPDGVIAGNVRAAVTSALHSFLVGLTGHSRDSEQLEVFRRLGRLEAESGRSHDTLQTAYRVATHQVAEFLALVAGQVGAAPEQRATVRHAVIAFIEHLASLSRAGYEEANLEGAARAQATTRLLELLVAPGEVSRTKLLARARQLEWAVPERVRAVELVPESLFQPAVLRTLREVVGPSLLVGRLSGRCVGFVAADVEAGVIAAALPAPATAILGPALRVLDAARSARIAHRFAHRPSPVRTPGVLDCTDHLLSLFGSDAVDVMDALAEARLGPLAQLGIVRRIKAARVLSALLEYGGLPRDAPELTDVSPSTLQYRKAMVEEMFGPALRDRQRRVELLLALRAVLPQWETEFAMHERRRQRTGPAGTAGHTRRQVAEPQGPSAVPG